MPDGNQCRNEATHDSSHYSCSESKYAKNPATRPEYLNKHQFCKNCAYKPLCPRPDCAGKALDGEDAELLED